MFPALPRASLGAFRVALGIGLAIVAALWGVRLYGVALLAAAVLVPLLTLLYLYDVDVYEEQPVRVLTLTFGAGAVGGAIVGLISRFVAPAGVDVLTQSSGTLVVVEGVLLPLAGLGLVLGGPIALLLPRASFNDALDGATFGAVAGVAFSGAETIARGTALLDAGLRPIGESLPWLLRLLTVGVLMPALFMTAAAGACSALWLRYRAPVRSRAGLGMLGRPAVALPAAAVLLIGAAATRQFLPLAAWTGLVAASCLTGLIWMRHAIQIGLAQEGAEVEIGPSITCANCGRSTAGHTFCAHCGVALRALPNGAERLRRRWLLLAQSAVVLVTAGALSAAAALAAPAEPRAPCEPGRACGRPPQPLSPLISLAAYRNGALGYSFEYPDDQLAIVEERESGVSFHAREELGASLTVEVDAAPAGEASPEQLLEQAVDELRQRTVGITRDDAPESQVLGPMIGYRDGIASVWAATVDSAQGPSQALTSVLIAARHGDTSAVVVASTTERSATRRVLGVADVVLTTFRFPEAPTG